MIIATNMPEYTTHHLWLQEQDDVQTSNYKHNHNHWYARMHNSPPMIVRAVWRIDMESLAWL